MKRSSLRFAPVTVGVIVAAVLVTSIVYLDAPWFALGAGLLLAGAAVV